MLFMIKFIFIILFLKNLSASSEKFEITFYKITSKTNFDCYSKIHNNIKVRSVVECLHYCSKRNECNYVNYKNEQCVLYTTLAFNQNYLDGTFWYKNMQPVLTYTYPGLTIGYPFNRLCKIGFRLVYDEYYSHITLTIELQNIRSQCNSSSILCAAGGLVNTDILTLISCANCHSVLTITPSNSPVHLGSSHWYMTPNQSFGFAPNSTINLSPADSYDSESLFRLSWHLDLNSGWRLGNLLSLNNNINYKKYILIR